MTGPFSPEPKRAAPPHLQYAESASDRLLIYPAAAPYSERSISAAISLKISKIPSLRTEAVNSSSGNKVAANSSHSEEICSMFDRINAAILMRFG